MEYERLLKSDTRSRIQKEKTDNFDDIEMKVFSIFKKSVKPNDTKILEKVNMTNMANKGLISLMHIFKTLI